MYYLKKKSEPKKKAKKKPDYIKKLDAVFSMYIRLRDSKPYGYKYFKCPTCGRVLPFEQADCSHYFSRRSNSTRFDEDNCMAECRYDNRFNAEHLHKMREALIKKLGEERFQLLEWKHNQSKKWSEFELKALIKYYQQLIDEMKSEC